MPSDFIGLIEVPDPGSSGAFPLVTQYPWSFTQAPEVIVHTIAASTANLKLEQRFYIGPRAQRFFVRCSMNATNRHDLIDFWNDRSGPYQAFDYAAPNEDETHTHYTVRFETAPLSVEHLSDALSTCGVWLVEVPAPSLSYSVASTVTRLPVHDDALDTALRSQTQEIIPLLKIQPRELIEGNPYPAIYVSDRRVTIASQLYQARLTDWAGIAQSIGGSSDLAQFTFGNADRVMTLLANDTNLWRADVEFALFHVGSTIKLNLWKGELNDWSCDDSPEFKVSASDGLYALGLPYPIRKIDRRCWKKAGDGINCMSASPTCSKVFLKTTDETATVDCTTLAQILRFGGINVKPQNIGPSKSLTLGSKTYNLTPTSIVNDSCYGSVLPDIYVAPDPVIGTPRPMPVQAAMANGGEEGNGEFYVGMGLVGRGPLGSYATTAMVPTADGGSRLAGHTLDGQAHHGFGTSNPTYGLRTSLGPAVCDADADNFTLLGATPKTYAAGTAWVELKRTDTKGIQPTKTSNHQMEVLVATGLTGWTWTAPGARSGSRSVLSNPIWVAVNVILHALGLDGGTSAQQEAVFDCAAAVAAAAVCSTSVERITPADGVHEAQFTFVGVLAKQMALRDWLTDILRNCSGFWVNRFGKVAFDIRYHSGTSEGGDFGLGNILLNSLTLRPFQPAFNHLTGTFGNSEYDWKTDTVLLYDEGHAELLGTVSPIYNQAEMALVGTCTKSQAARLVTARLREELGGITEAEWTAARQINFRTTVLSLAVEAGMICQLTHPDMPNGAGEFRVTGWRLNRDYSIDIEGRTTTDSMYDLTVGEKPADIVADPLPGELVLNPGASLPGVLMYTPTLYDRDVLTLDNCSISTFGVGAFTGTGLNDATTTGAYTGWLPTTFEIKVSIASGTDSFQWRLADDTWSADVAMTGAAQLLSHGVSVTFAATTGHTLDDLWIFPTAENNLTLLQNLYCALVYIDELAMDAWVTIDAFMDATTDPWATDVTFNPDRRAFPELLDSELFAVGDWIIFDDPGNYECAKIIGILGNGWVIERHYVGTDPGEATFESMMAQHAAGTKIRKLNVKLFMVPVRGGGWESPTGGISTRFDFRAPCISVVAVVAAVWNSAGFGPWTVYNCAGLGWPWPGLRVFVAERRTFGIEVSAVGDQTDWLHVRRAGRFSYALTSAVGTASGDVHLDFQKSVDEGATWRSIFPAGDGNQITLPADSHGPIWVDTFADMTGPDGSADNEVKIGDLIRQIVLEGSAQTAEGLNTILEWN